MSISSKIASVIEAGGFVVTAGIVPPEAADPGALARAAESLSGKIHAAVVSDCEGARMSGLAAGVHLAKAGIEPVLELTTRDMNRTALQSMLVGAASLGINNVICAPGNHQSLDEKTRSSRGVFDLDPIQLLGLAHNLNHGTELVTGTTTNPFSDPIELQVIVLEKAAASGARFVITSPVFDLEKFEAWMKLVRERGLDKKIHIIAGILPIEGKDEALETREKYRGVSIPDSVVEKVSLDYAVEVIKAVQKIDGVRGIHIYDAGEGRTARVLDSAGIKL